MLVNSLAPCRSACTNERAGVRNAGDKIQEEWPSLPATLQASASGSKLNATAKDFTPPVSEHGGPPAPAADSAAQQPRASGQLPYRPYVPQPMPVPQVYVSSETVDLVES